ncbi:MAG TPA: ATP-binding protein [Jiangellaceae bacterium]
MAESAGTLGEVLASRRRVRFVGRTAELELFGLALDSAEPPFSILYVHGPGGVGKTSLLDAFAEQAALAGAAVIRIDGRDISPSPQAVLDALAGIGDAFTAGTDPVWPAKRTVIMIDTYERLAPLDDWVRGTLAPRLPLTVLTVIAGRSEPALGWRADSAWRDLLRVVSLRNLSSADGRHYLDQCNIRRDLHDRLLNLSHGHPLALSLLADVVVRGGPAMAEVESEGLPRDLVDALVGQFVDVLPTEQHRRALEACALARVTTEALVRDVLELDDAHELFEWLRELAVVESGPDGLYPHDLARDVLDVDLRWRDPEGYKRTFRRVRDHIHRRLAATHGREQQRAIFDEKYLFRNLPSILSPIDWSDWGRHYPEQAQPGDRDQILDLVAEWEGDESRAIAERWLHAQPEGFFVLRRQEGSVSGVIGQIDLTAASAEDLAVDPGARVAWQVAHRNSPPRAGEVVEQTRFVIDRDVYQEPSPTLNATPILSIQRCLQRPNLALGLLTMAEPEPWDAYFAAADIPRVPGADFTIGGRRFGLFAHDFRQVPVDAWLELVTERALAQDFTLPPAQPAEPLVLSKEDFDGAARQALRDLHRPDLLARNPLLRSRVLRDRNTDREPDAVDLEGALSDALDALRANPRDDKLFRAVERTYVLPATTQEAAAEALGIPFSTYRRHLGQGVDRVTAWLWQREVYGTRH